MERQCECANRYEAVINSLALFEEINEFFQSGVERGVFEDAPISVPLERQDDHGRVFARWYPDKWYRCRVCGQLWAFIYPEFPALGNVYKLNRDGVPERGSIYWNIR